VFCALVVTVKTCVLKVTIKKRQLFCVPEFAPMEKILRAPMIAADGTALSGVTRVGVTWGGN